jgi:pantetheine-phosphate adenylyltransferase
MRIAVYPGSFDPITFGHLDIIERAAKLFDKLYIAIACNIRKKYFFSEEKRLELIKGCIHHLSNVEVYSFNGLLVDFCYLKQAKYIIRGLRTVTDFDYEFQILSANRKLSPDIDTIFLTADIENQMISSSIVREIAFMKGDISQFVPNNVINAFYG